ncbi:MAG: efflux RND transporter periplasmic adaptor subunit, partial [Congregibacter sp.]|nr:efflux RND transporter periplasmic adaptor subunit [Congregibacter sp.]
IEAVNEATLSAQTTGRVLEVNFDVGDYVQRGAIILRLSDQEQTSRVQAAEGALAEAMAGLSEARLVDQRNQDLIERKLIARAEIDRTTAALLASTARVDSATAALSEARENLSYTVVTAPYAGTVVKRFVQPGESVSPGTPLMTGLSLEQLRVVVNLPQQQINALRAYQRARVLLPADRSVAATSLRIPPQASSDTHTFRVLVSMPEADYGVFPGSLVKVAFVVGEENRLLAPASAIVQRSEVTGAYVLDEEGYVGFRYVRLGPKTPAGSYIVMAGLVAGDQVALDPIKAGIAYKRQIDSTSVQE